MPPHVLLSRHVSLADAIASQTASRLKIDNVPPAELLPAMRNVAKNVYDLLYDAAGGRIRINSFYRSPVLNKAVKGSKNSQHVVGEAIDIDATGTLTNGELYRMVKRVLPTWDQVIWEFGDDRNPAWVHVSLRASGNRKMELRIG